LHRALTTGAGNRVLTSLDLRGNSGLAAAPADGEESAGGAPARSEAAQAIFQLTRANEVRARLATELSIA